RPEADVVPVSSWHRHRQDPGLPGQVHAIRALPAPARVGDPTGRASQITADGPQGDPERAVGVKVGRVIISDSFVVADWTDAGTHPGRPIAGLHLHRSDDEAWIVLGGRLGFRVGEEERLVDAGDSLLVRRGTPHSFWNAVAQPTRYLLVMTPRIHQLV